jgi:subtilase family serine protease
MKFHRRRTFRPALESLDHRCLPSGLTPSQVTSAYGLNAIAFKVNGTSIQGNGAGQLIAIIDAYHDPYLASDLAYFDATYHLPAALMAQINLAGSTTNSGWAEEEALDVEWAHAIAPGAGIIVVEARSSSIQDLIAAVNVAKSIPLVSVVSMSWGGSEGQSETSYDSVFTTPAGHTGITFVAASGDSGASGGAEYPSSSPNVLSVGGTTLSVSSTGTYLGESVWSGSGGGYSRYETEPAYQRGFQSTGVRSTPDVSFDADPNTGVAVYVTDPSSGRGSWQQVGGTSLGAPAWAAIVAIADEGRYFAGKGTLNSATQTMTALYSLPSTDFHAVSTITTNSRFRPAIVASPGLGSPNGAALVNGLVAYSGSGTSVATTTGVKTAVTVKTANTKVRFGRSSILASVSSLRIGSA